MNQKETSLKDIFNNIWKGKWIIIITVVIVLMITLFGISLMKKSKGYVSTVIYLEWDGIDKGQYPDGTIFVYDNTFDSTVIGQALAELDNKKLDEITVKDKIQIEPILSADVAAKVQKAIEAGENPSYYANNYRVIFNHASLGLSRDEGTHLLSTIIQKYQIEFSKKYIVTPYISNLASIGLDEYEYIEAYNVLEKQLTLIDNVVNNEIESLKNNVNENIKIGFNDVLIKSSFIKDISLKQISSKIDTYSLHKDKEYLMSRYLYEIKNLELNLANSQAKATNIQTMIDNYQGNTQTILIPGMDPSQILKIDTYYDSLLKELIAKNNEIVNYQTQIDSLNMHLKRLKGEDPNFTITPEEQAVESEKLEKMIINTNFKIDELVYESNLLLKEYNQTKAGNVVKTLMNVNYANSLNIFSYISIGLAVGISLGIGIVFLRKKD